jgi:siderophore synthetase component
LSDGKITDSEAEAVVDSLMSDGKVTEVKIDETLIKGELKSKLDEAKKSDIKIYTDNSRLLKRFPKEFIYHLRKIVRTMDKKTKNNLEKERLVADILDNLQVNLKLSPKDVKRSYEFHRNQKRLQKILNKES